MQNCILIEISLYFSVNVFIEYCVKWKINLTEKKINTLSTIMEQQKFSIYS